MLLPTPGHQSFLPRLCCVRQLPGLIWTTLEPVFPQHDPVLQLLLQLPTVPRTAGGTPRTKVVIDWLIG